MYCPRCGHQSISEALRFCSNCGFKLGVVKASLADEDDVSAETTFTIQVINKEPRQRDINIGVILMFAGALLATFLAGRSGLRLGREGGALILAISFASILLLSRPLMKTIYKLLSWEEQTSSLHQRGMLFGSILMFISTIVLTISSLLMLGRMSTPQLLLALAGAFVLLLVISKHLMRAVRYLVAGEQAHDPAAVSAADSIPALTAGQNVPASLFTAQRINTAEILSPASVTEQTTNLLENK